MLSQAQIGRQWQQLREEISYSCPQRWFRSALPSTLVSAIGPQNDDVHGRMGMQTRQHAMKLVPG
jgi:hypothetical protein